MRTFTDNGGRAWTVQINVAAVKRVRGLVGIDLYQLVDDGFQGLGNLVSDPVQLADVLYCLVKEEADARQITDEEFGRGLAGDAITQAADAFVEELIDFFPDARARAGLRKVIDAGRKVRQRLLTHAETLLETIDPEAEATKLIASFGSLPASSDSTPDLLPSGS
jgi:hypothetical protein